MQYAGKKVLRKEGLARDKEKRRRRPSAKPQDTRTVQSARRTDSVEQASFLKQVLLARRVGRVL